MTTDFRIPAPGYCHWILLLACCLGAGLECRAQDPPPVPKPALSAPTTNEMFAQVAFEKWQTEGPRQQIPWKVHMEPGGLSFHQRLVAGIHVEVPGHELIKRRQDGRVVMLVEVRDQAGRNYRDFGVLELADVKPELTKSDIQFSWRAFAVPGDYSVALALYDQASGEHNFTQGKFHVPDLKHDPLPDAWQGLPAWEFWSPATDGPDNLYRPEIAGRLRLPLSSKRPLRVEVLGDLTPSDLFHGSYALYNSYLAGAVPILKALSDVTLSNGSLQLGTLDLVQRKVTFAQNDGKPLDWKRLKATLAPANGPGVVDVRSVPHGRQNPVFLREELAHRIAKPKEDGKVLQVLIVIGSAMDTYAFPELPPIAFDSHEEANCVVYYLQYMPWAFRPVVIASEPTYRFPPDLRGYPTARPRGNRRTQASTMIFTGAVGNVQKLLKPLKVKAFQVHNPEEARRAVAKILDEIGHM